VVSPGVCLSASGSPLASRQWQAQNVQAEEEKRQASTHGTPTRQQAGSSRLQAGPSLVAGSACRSGRVIDKQEGGTCGGTGEQPLPAHVVVRLQAAMVAAELQ